MSVINIKNLAYSYGNKTVLGKINLDFSEPMLVGLFGHNGSGKSTLLKILSALLSCQEGEINFYGSNSLDKNGFIASKFRHMIGALFQTTSSDALLSASDNLRYFTNMMGVNKKDEDELLNNTLMLANLKAEKDQRVKTLSHGMRRRLEIYRTFMHKPKLVFLDEPTAGLDVQECERFWSFIKDYQKQEKALILCATHYPLELEYCDSVVMMHEGLVIAQENARQLSEETNHWRYEYDLDAQGEIRSIYFARADLTEAYEERCAANKRHTINA